MASANQLLRAVTALKQLCIPCTPSEAGGWNFGSVMTQICAVQKQQALLGQMLTEGYGCTADAAAGKDWTDKARRRGYKMSGVYCEI